MGASSLYGGGGGSNSTVQTLKGNPGTGNLESQLNASFKSFMPIDGPNLVLVLNPGSEVFSDDAFTTPQVTQNGVVASTYDQSGDANDLINTTLANAPLLQLLTNGINGLPALQFCDSQSAPTKGLVLQTATNVLSAGMAQSFTMYFVVEMTNDVNGYAILRPGGDNVHFGKNDFGVEFNNGLTVGSICQLYGNNLAVVCFAYDGVNLATRFNNKEVITPVTGNLWGSGKTITLGGYTNDGSTFFSSLAKMGYALIYEGTHGVPVAQGASLRALQTAQLMDVWGITQTRQLILGGNSIDHGFSEYTIPWPVDLGFMLGSQYILKNFSVIGETTSQQATRAVGNALTFGGINGTTPGAATGVPTPTQIPAAASAWAVNQFAGKWVVMTSGVNAGMAAKITSNSVNALFCEAPGFASASAAADTFSIMSGVTNGQLDIYFAHELTNDAIATGATDGPSANGGVVATCKLFLRYKTWCQAMRAAGFKVVAFTYADRLDGPTTYANFTADRLAINAYMTANWKLFADQFVDYTVDTRFAAAVDGNTWWLPDGIHPTNAGARVMNLYIAPAVRLLTGLY